ncbi:MAG TPA: ImmA/IrrE family metallo-endopeptidase [Bacillota bacterium]|nr:ImmA/IrrE family metallo-endopeptidase [Bacillota bacterium]
MGKEYRYNGNSTESIKIRGNFTQCVKPRGKRIPIYISNNEMVEIANGIIRSVYGSEPYEQVDIKRIADFFGITIVFDKFAESDLDNIGFLSNGIKHLLVWRDGIPTPIVFPKNVIVLDELLIQESEVTRFRFTVAHEIGHFVQWRANPSQFTSEFSTITDSNDESLSEQRSVSDNQANIFAGALLMPADLVVRKLNKHLHSPVVPVFGSEVFMPQTKVPLQNAADELGVSHTMLLIQLKKYGLLEPHDICDYIKFINKETGEDD